MSDFESHFKLIQLQGEMRDQRNVMLQLRKFLGGALCCVCGEPLGMEAEIISDDEDRTIHKNCEGDQ